MQLNETETLFLNVLFSLNSSTIFRQLTFESFTCNPKQSGRILNSSVPDHQQNELLSLISRPHAYNQTHAPGNLTTNVCKPEVPHQPHNITLKIPKQRTQLFWWNSVEIPPVAGMNTAWECKLSALALMRRKPQLVLFNGKLTWGRACEQSVDIQPDSP